MIVLDTLTFIISLPFIAKSIKKITSLKFSVLHIAIISFWLMNVLPLIVYSLFDYSLAVAPYVKISEVMNDKKTSLFYDISVIVILILLFKFANKLDNKQNEDFFDRFNFKFDINPIAYYILEMGMISPLFAIIFAPHPKVYLQIGYFYKNNFDTTIEVLNYHKTIVPIIETISFLCIIALYFIRKSNSKSYNFDIYISIFLITILNQKRTLLLYIFIIILVIDIITSNRSDNKKVLFKGAILLILFLTYFYAYSRITGKGDNDSFISNYLFYYSRMINLKTSLYDCLNGMNILDYIGETILFNIFFFIPRTFWPTKPVMYVKYFTAYAVRGDSLAFLNWNFQVNIWSEFVSNFGLLGIILGCFFLYKIVEIAEKSDNIFSILLCTAFICLYNMYGFENTVAEIWILLILSIIFKNKLILIQRRLKNEY